MLDLAAKTQGKTAGIVILPTSSRLHPEVQGTVEEEHLQRSEEKPHLSGFILNTSEKSLELTVP